MVKKCNWISVGLIILALAMVLIACASPETPLQTTPEPQDTTPTPTTPAPKPLTAEDVESKIFEREQQIRSYETATTVNARFYGGDSKETALTLIANGAVLFDESGSYDYYTHSSVNYKAEDEEATPTVYEVTETYLDGKIYLAYQNGDFSRKVFSPMVAEVYNSHREDVTVDANALPCESKILTENGDGTYILTFSSYSEASIAEVLSVFSLSMDGFGGKITDMSVAFSVNSEFYVTRMAIELQFEVIEGTRFEPEFTYVVDYKNYNSATVSDKIQVEEYTEIGDIGTLFEIDRFFRKRQEDDNGLFTLGVEAKIKTVGYSDSITDVYTVKYGETDGKFHYEVVKNNANSVRYEKIKGANGFCITYDASDTPRTYKRETEYEARAYIDSMIYASGYNLNYVTSFAELEPGVYRLTCAISDETFYRELLDDMDLDFGAVSQTITVTVEDGVLTKVVGDTVINGWYQISSGGSLHNFAVDVTIQTRNGFAER